ncbi:hypothetical protein MKFW12EY_30450 [Methylomonas koyamae]|nr:hypothetical protein MKFW12EY_30450 [Methylomonas koyamae]
MSAAFGGEMDAEAAGDVGPNLRNSGKAGREAATSMYRPGVGGGLNPAGVVAGIVSVELA